MALCPSAASRSPTTRSASGVAVGRAFATELGALDETFTWALSQDIEALERFVEDVADRPLLAIGSGGSSTACHLTALLHRMRHGQPASFTTPLDVLTVPAGLHRAGIFLASASGRNKDVLAALRASVAEEAPALGAITLRKKNLLSEYAAAYPRAHVFAADAPAGKDGFLATNTLVATCVLIARAYGFETRRPQTPRVLHDASQFEPRHMVQVLHGGWSSPVATDLESKLNESALAAAQVSDYRNFGHGRHLWLARRAAETVVVALVTPGTRAIATSTLKHFPKDIPILRLEAAFDGPAGTIDLLYQAFHFVGQLGQARVQDPGRPHVPEFGRKLYRLAPPQRRSAVPAPIQRKIWASPAGSDRRELFSRGLESFLVDAQTADIGAVALDYDGTLCSRDGRFDGLRADIVEECTRLLQAGVRIGIATGRGKSVRHEMQNALDRKFWPLVQIGYYNARDIAALADDTRPRTDGPIDPGLEQAYLLLIRDSWLTTMVQITARPQQLTIEPTVTCRTDALASHVMSCLAPLDGMGVRLVVSSHSLDVLGPGPGKGSLVKRLRAMIDTGHDVLCIGDRGAWPGNDYTLLAERLSLSVDEVSSSSDSCWNLAPRGVSGPDATLLYLRALEPTRGVATFKWKARGKR